MNKLPKIVWIYREEEGTEDEFLSLAEKCDGLVEMKQKRLVGKYKLIETMIVEGVQVNSQYTPVK